MLTLLLVGCAFHQKPFEMYDSSLDKSETTVFSSIGEGNTKYTEARIVSVDGMETSCVQAGCPYWVRLAPGDHTITVHYQTDFALRMNEIRHNLAELEIQVKGMESKHVYGVKYSELNGSVASEVIDLGESPDYGLYLGQEGINRKFYPVTF